MLVLASPNAAHAQGTTHRILNELQSVHPHSAPGPMVSTPDGETLFVAESGVVAVIDADLAASYADPVKILPISSHGVRAVELLLDPDADLEGDPAGDESILYVAGGRLGLWAQRADPRPNQPMPAARIDDADSPGNQENRRWCNDVAIMEHGNATYLLALFAEQGCSRLRVYPLSTVRAVLNANPGEETGNEFWPVVEVPIGANCQFQTPRHESFGFGLAVDGTTVYVAMGVYGIVRARFANPDITIFQKHDGPYFGTGSLYALNVHSVYDHWEFRGGDPPVVLRSDPPWFMDVAIEVQGRSRYLWAAVDHLGVLRFDVTNPALWSTTLRIDHQEGILVQGSTTRDAAIRLVRQGGPGDESDTVKVRNYAHRLRIEESSEGPVLAVCVNREAFVVSNSLLDEGRRLGYLGDGYAGIPVADPGPDVEGDHHYTLLYDLDPAVFVARPPDVAPPAHAQHVTFDREGGRHVHLASAPPAGHVIVFGGREDPELGAHTTFRDFVDWPTAVRVEEMFARTAADRPGRLVYDISHSLANQDLLYTGSNDSGLYSDGILVTCGNTIRRFYDDGNDLRTSMGILFNPVAVWPGPPQPGTGAATELILGANKATEPSLPFPAPQAGQAAWMLAHFRPGTDLCLPTPTLTPEHLKRLFVTSPPDAFQYIGRMHYLGGVANADYDAHVLTTEGPGKELAFVNRSDTPAGVVVLLRPPIETLLLAGATPDNSNADPASTSPVSFQRELITHPEFDQVYLGASPPAGFVDDNGLRGKLATYPPRLAKIPAPTGPPESLHWVLSVPSGAVYYPPSLPDQPPSIFQQSFEQAMVRVFDVHDWDDATNSGAAIPAYTLVGPRKKTSAFRIEPLAWQGRYYLFVAGTLETLDVWDVTDLLGEPSGSVFDANSAFHLEEWVTPLSVSDELSNNLFGLALDHVVWEDEVGARDDVYVYVAVARVGIEVLRFLPSNPPGQRLESVARIETPSGMAGLKIRQGADPNERTLLVGESLAGIRTFIYGED